MAKMRGRILNVDDYVPARYARTQALIRAGYEELEAGTGAEALRIVAVTGWGQDDDREKSREAGFDVHLVKPVDPNDLVRVLDEKSG